MRILIASLALTLAATSQAISLAKGQTDYYRFNTNTGQSYEIGFSANSSCSGSLSQSCCVMLVNNSATNPTTSLWEQAVAAPDLDPASLVIDGNGGPISVGIHAIEACDYNAPTILTSRATPSTLQFGSATGQLGDSISNLPTTQAQEGGGHMLRDISRRQSMVGVNGNPNQGQMADWGELTARRVFGYFQSIDFFLTDNPKDSDSVFDQPDQQELADALANSGKVYDYWLSVLGLNSYDNNSAPMHAQTNAPFPPVPALFCGEPYPANSLFNAFWDGYEIVFTPRDFTEISGNYYPHSLSAALDVTAHEWGHAISDRAVDLAYQRESGALNEAYSDWMGAAVEWANGETNWTMGEGVATIRDMADPRRFNDPDTYRGQYWRATDQASCPVPDICENDYCGVHSNSGVANKMFTLLAAGGSHNGVTVTGVGVDTAMRIATDALHHYWTANTDFIGAREGMVQAAGNYGSNAVQQVRLAWSAVGVEERSTGSETLDRLSGGGGGGCAAGTGSPADPVLWLLLLIAAGHRLRRRFAAL